MKKASRQSNQGKYLSSYPTQLEDLGLEGKDTRNKKTRKKRRGNLDMESYIDKVNKIKEIIGDFIECGKKWLELR